MADLPVTVHPLQNATRPSFESGESPFRLVDLFCGCGGLTLGIAQALAATGRALDVRLAVDFEAIATAVYSTNFPQANVVETAPVQAIFDGKLGSLPTPTESRWAAEIGEVSALVGGPPCQGHSSLNNHTRGDDPKNGLYLFMARAAEILKPAIVMIENVPAVRSDRFEERNVVESVRAELTRLGYKVADAVVRMHGLGVPQKRKRHVLLATLKPEIDPAIILKTLESHKDEHDLRWAIGDLEDKPSVGIDKHPTANQVNLERMNYLLTENVFDLPNPLRPKCHQDDHSYKSMYGRLSWELPAQTITSGFSSIGQGRYMHPSKARALTAHEAARIQGFPDYFDFSAVVRRSDLATMIGNAVPPQMSAAVFAEILRLESAVVEGAQGDDPFQPSET